MTTHETATRYPLTWPTGWKRTKDYMRERARFRNGRQQLTVAGAIDRLQVELDRLGATDEVLSTNVRVRIDGLPRSGEREPDDPGVAVYFSLKKQPRCLACDKWDRVADNIAAIAAHIEAIRAVDRYGVGTLDQAFAGYAALPAPATGWRSVLGFGAGDAVTHQLALAKTDRAENATAGVVIARASLAAVLHQMEQGEASDVFDLGIVNPDTQRDLRWCRDQLKEALAAIS